MCSIRGSRDTPNSCASWPCCCEAASTVRGKASARGWVAEEKRNSHAWIAVAKAEAGQH